MYAGRDLASLAPMPGVRNPVLTTRDVTDVEAESICDPFIVQHAGIWHLFFEVVNAQLGRKQIGLATSEDGVKWTYQRIVLEEPFDVSYPYVFSWQGAYYMVPETPGLRSVRLYKATAFPTGWQCVGTILQGARLEAPSIAKFGNRWWLFAAAGQHDILRVFSATSLTGPWTEHPKSPVLWDDPAGARPCGRIVVLDGQLVRFAQDCSQGYGEQVWQYVITDLTPTSYRERRAPGHPILGPSARGWNARGMHHVDANRLPNGQWIASVDGWTLTRKLRRAR